MAELDVNYASYGALMGAGVRYVVPDYQRRYAWKSGKQVTELWGDVLRLYRICIDNPDDKSEHFIGSVVVGSAPVNIMGAADAPVIDGQQRLITIGLMIAAIRDFVVADEESKGKLTRKYLAHDDGKGGFVSTRVQPKADDAATYDAIIRGLQVADKSSQVLANYQFIVAMLHEGPDLDDDPDVEDSELALSDEEVNLAEEPTSAPTPGDLWDWMKLVEVVASRLSLVSISQVPQERAYSIFASLNSTGAPLDQVDLIRNGLFMLLPRKGAEIHERLWRPIETSFNSDELRGLLHAWISRKGYNVPVKDMYGSYLAHFRAPGHNEASIERDIQSLFECARTYFQIRRPTKSIPLALGDRQKQGGWAAAQRVLERLAAWGATTMEPLLVEVLMRYDGSGAKKGKLQSSDMVSCLEILESFVVRRFICNVPPNDLRSVFNRILQQILDTPVEQTRAKLAELLSEPSRRWPTDAELKGALMAKPLYRTTGKKQAFAILRRLALTEQGKEAPVMKLGTGKEDYSIEHIMPQNLNDAWRRDLTKWGVGSPAELHSTSLHLLGNLTITAYNAELADSSFASKKKIYAKSALAMNLSLSQLASWDSSAIELRGRALAKTACKAWPRPPH